MRFNKVKKYGFIGLVKELAFRTMFWLYGKHVVHWLVIKTVRKREPDKWVFILGCYNSGTTILRTLLSNHPEFRILHREGVRFTKELPRPEDLGWTRMWVGCPEYMEMPDSNEQGIANNVIKDWSPWWKAGGSVFLEKSISSLTRVDWLARNFPNAYFIGITRDGYAVSEGIHRRAHPQGDVKKRFGENYPLEWAARQWVDANSRLLEASRNVEQYHQLSYESLVAEPVNTLKGIFEFIGVDTDGLIKGSQNGVTVNGKTTSLFDGNSLSFQRLSPEDIEQITTNIAGMQKKLGYLLK